MNEENTDDLEIGRNGNPINETTDKIQKVLAQAGKGSRREMEKAISAGRVLMNGSTAKLGDRVSRHDTLSLDGHPIALGGPKAVRRVIVYNKPEGEVCTRKDPENRPNVFQHLPKMKGERWIAVGRLDINTSGLLLFTTDGELANRLMHPSHKIEREYAVRVLGDVDMDMINRMHEGVMLEDGMANFTDIQGFGGKGANAWYHVVIMEGRNREVRRLWESQGVQVSRLKRVRYGNVFMDPDVRAGTWKEMTRKEIDQIAKTVELPSAPWRSLFKGMDVHEKKRSSRQKTRRHV